MSDDDHDDDDHDHHVVCHKFIIHRNSIERKMASNTGPPMMQDIGRRDLRIAFVD